MHCRPRLESLEDRDLPSAGLSVVVPLTPLALALAPEVAGPKTAAQALRPALSDLFNTIRQRARYEFTSASDLQAQAQRLDADPMAQPSTRVMAHARAEQAFGAASATIDDARSLRDLLANPDAMLLDGLNALESAWYSSRATLTVRETILSARFHALLSDPTVDPATKTQAYYDLAFARGQLKATNDDIANLQSVYAIALLGVRP